MIMSGSLSALGGSMALIVEHVSKKRTATIAIGITVQVISSLRLPKS